MTGSDTTKSQLEEWRAISQAALSFPPEVVRTAFEAAVRWDSANESAIRNRKAFEASMKAPQSLPNFDWEKKSKDAVRLYGLVEGRYQSRQPAMVS